MTPAHDVAKSKPTIGLTGGMGAGKSAAAQLLGQLGCGVIDADQLAKEALKDPKVLDQLVAWWGESIRDGQGCVDRKQLSKIVFNDDVALKKLESVTHPQVEQKRKVRLADFQADPSVLAIVEDCPLLMEVGLDKGCFAVIFIQSPRPLRLSRLAKSRGWSDSDLALREKKQLPLDIKATKADYVVVNDADECGLKAQIQSVFSQIMNLHISLR